MVTKGPLELPFRAGETGVLVDELELPPLALPTQLALVPREDIPRHLVHIHRRLGPHPVALDASEELRPEPRLLPEARIPDVIGIRREMRSIGVELIEIRRPIGAAEARPKSHAVLEPVERAEGRREGSEGPGDRRDIDPVDEDRARLERGESRVIVPRTELDTQGPRAQLLDGKERHRPIGGRRSAQRPRRSDIPVLRAHPDRPGADRTDGPMPRDDLPDAHALLEPGRDLPTPLDLIMQIVGEGRGGPDALEPSALGVPVSLATQTVATHRDVDPALVRPDEPTRDPVVIPEEAIGESGIAPVPHHGGTDAPTRERGLGVAHHPDRRPEIPGATQRTFPPHGEPRHRRFHPPAEGRPAICGAPLRTHRAVRMLGGGGRDLMPDEIDHPAEGTRAIEERHRPPDHLDPLCGQWIDRHRMIHGCRGEIAGALAILQDHDAIPAHPADDRPRRGLPHLRQGDAGDPHQRRREGPVEAAIQSCVAQHARRRDRVTRPTLGDLSGDHGRRHLHRLLAQRDAQRHWCVADHEREIRRTIPDALDHETIRPLGDRADDE